MIEHVIIGALFFLLVAQNIYWAKVCFGLTNRIMSRNYAELRQAEHKPLELKAVPQAEEYDPVAEKQARELNSMLGMVQG